MNWDDLKVFLALSRKGSARGAAQELGVSNSTVTRRLDEHLAGTENHAHLLFTLMVLERWAQERLD